MFRAIRPTSTLYRASALYKNAAVSSPARASMAMNFARMYSAGAGLARSDVEKRVLDILAGFNKVDAKKEFSIEIPDKDADEIKSAEQAVEYISKRDDAH
ncbi:hypothetical protein BGZ93_006920 [Podila epicladia]|nr:hypothetical protein BGZ93_006920 [Podila epicladia]